MKSKFPLKKFSLVVIFFTIVSMTSCEIQPVPIEFGQDHCDFCQMTIVDKSHASEIVTKKGKALKFDATECMIHKMKDLDTTKIALYLTVDFLQPEKMINATKATFLISENITSPMGANLATFKSEEDALSLKEKKGGQLYSWKELIDILSK